MVVVDRADNRIREILFDFRGDDTVRRLQGSGKFSLNEKLLIQEIPKCKWLKSRPSFIVRWFQALRLHYLGLSFFPQLVVIAAFKDLNWLAVLLTAITISLFHISCNLWNDFSDHLKGIDNPDNQGGSGVIQKLWIPAVHIRAAAGVFLGLSIFSAFIQFAVVDFGTRLDKIILISLLSMFLAFNYSGGPLKLKYRALGELVFFLLCGPLFVFAYFLTVTEMLVPEVTLLKLSFPLGFLASIRLFLMNLQRIPYDHLAGAITVPILLHFKLAKYVFLFAIGCLFLGHGILFFPEHWLNSFILFNAVPAIALARTVFLLKGPLDPNFYFARKAMSLFHVSFISLFAILCFITV